MTSGVVRGYTNPARSTHEVASDTTLLGEWSLKDIAVSNDPGTLCRECSALTLRSPHEELVQRIYANLVPLSDLALSSTSRSAGSGRVGPRPPADASPFCERSTSSETVQSHSTSVKRRPQLRDRVLLQATLRSGSRPVRAEKGRKGWSRGLRAF